MKNRLVHILTDHDNVSGYPDLTKMTEKSISEEFGITMNDASVIRMVVDDNTPLRSAYGLPESRSTDFLNMVQEALHQGLDGWTDKEKYVIRAFLSDITYAVHIE